MSSASQALARGIADAMWVSLWADHVNEKGGVFPPGTALDRVAPLPPRAAFDMAFYVLGRICGVNDTSPELLAYRVARTEQEEGDIDVSDAFCRELGWCLAMEYMGHGVSWMDDHEAHGLDIPSGGLSLCFEDLIYDPGFMETPYDPEEYKQWLPAGTPS